MYELIYTSVPKGLLPGRSGFATAAMSEGMPPNLIVPLENLSGYNFTLRDNTFLPVLNPPCCYYIKMRYGNQLLHIAGRVAPNGLDYSQRNNKIAHHLLFESPREMTNLAGGAAGLFLKDDVFCSEYTAEPAMLPFRKVPVCTQIGPLPARNWADLSGHAGLAAYTAERFCKTPDKPLYLIYPADTPVKSLLGLVMEVCALLDEAVRNNLTFSTYFGSSTAPVDCFLRMVPDFSPLVSNLRRFHPGDVIELGQENELVLSDKYPDIYEYACTGKKPEVCPQKTQLSAVDKPVNVVADDDLPAAPAEDFPDAPPTIVIPPPETPANYRKFIFAGAAIVIIAALASFLIYELTRPKLEQKKADDQIIVKTAEPPVVKPAVSAEKSNIPQIAKSEIKPPEPPAKKLEVPEKAPQSPAKKSTVTTPAKKPPVKAALIRQESLPIQTEVDLFIKFRKAGKANIVIKLPKLLHGVQNIDLVMERIGTATISARENRNFVAQGSVPGEVFVRAAIGGTLPPKPVPGNAADNPHLQIKISQDKKSLHITSYTGNRSDCIMPEARKIKTISFMLNDKVYLWNNTFACNHAAVLKPGKIIMSVSDNKPPEYIPKQQEKELKKYGFVETRFGNIPEANFTTNSFNFANWNLAVEDFNQVERKYRAITRQMGKMVKTTKAPRKEQEVQAFMKDVQKRASEGDLTTVKSVLPSFLDKFFNPHEKVLVSADDLQKFAKTVADSMKARQYSPQQKQEITNLYKSWESSINQLKTFQKLRDDFHASYAELLEAKKKCDYARERIVSTGKSIDISIGIKLSKMTSRKTTGNQDIPDKITPEEITDLCKAVKEKINFIPIALNSYGE